MIKESVKFSESNIFEGIVSIKALIKARENNINDRPIIKILFDDTKKITKYRELKFLKNKSVIHNYTIEFVNTEYIESLTIGNSHGGIIAFCGERVYKPLESSLTENGFYIMLDGIEDPYNFGYALRSLYAAGVDGIVLSPRNWMGAAGVVCRASAGASELFPMYISDSIEAVKKFKNRNYKIVCADIKNAVSIYKTELRFPLFLIIGGEKRGISKTILDNADNIIKLDYGREFPSALSTASAASIIAYEIFRQNNIK